LIELIVAVLLFILIAVLVTLSLAVVMSYVTQASYVDPIDERLDND
jgi:hypothetical protein